MTGQQLKNSILQMAVQGKLVPQDPNDEPASVLLDRIRKEKEKLIKEGKIKKEKNPSVIFRGADNLPYEKIGNNEPVCIADKVPFEIPDSWEWVRINDIFQIKMGQSPKGESVSNLQSGIEFHQGKVFFGEKYICRSNQTTNIPTKIAEPNSVLLCVRAPVGKVNITDRTLCIGRGLCALKPLGNINIDFSFHLLETFENIFVKQATGTTFIAITGDVVKNQLIPLPPLSEQNRILEKIKEILPLISEYSSLEKVSAKLLRTFPDLLKKSILQEAVQGKLVPQDGNDEPASVLLERIRAEKQRLIKEEKIKKDKNESIIFRRDKSYYEKLNGVERCIDDEIPFEIPDSWEWCRLKFVAEIQTGTTPPKSHPEYFGIGTPFIKPADISNKKIIYDNESLTVLGTEKGRLIPRRSVLMVCIGGSIGKCFYTDIDVCCNQQINTATPYLSDVRFLWITMSSKFFQECIKQNSSGTATPIINKSAWGDLLIPLPPLSEQHRIVAKYDEIIPFINNLAQ